MAGEEENKKVEGKGFAGLSSLVSDVSTTPPLTIKGAHSSAAQNAAQSSPNPQPTHHQAPIEESSPDSSGVKWILGIAIVVGVLWFISQLDQQSTSSTVTAQVASNTALGNPPPLVQPQVPSRPEEQMPQVGSDLVLSTAQIRYCLAEDIRISAAKSAVDNYNGSDVDRFNMMVADYNSRCGSFRYRSGALESARQDIEPYRNQLELEGANQFSPTAAPNQLEIPAATNEIGQAPDQVPEMLSQAITFVSQHQRSWSQSNTNSLLEISANYASIVNYYGKSMPAEAVMEDKRNFAIRWPERDYKFYPDYAASRCDTSSKCEVVGIVEWIASSSVRNDSSTGKAEVFFEVVSNGDSLHIVREGGQVISRTKQAYVQNEADLEAVLLNGLRPGSGNEGRLLDSGKVIMAYANAGLVSMKPDQRIDYSDYRLLSRPAYLFGNRIVVIDEEYFSGWIGCCVSRGLAVTVKLDGNLAELTSFAENNKCRLSRDSEESYAGPQITLPTAPIGTYATLSCKERDAQ